MKHKYSGVLILLFITVSLAIILRPAFALTFSKAIIANADDGYVWSYNTDYATARTNAYDKTSNTMLTGQQKSGANIYQVRRSFLNFDTSTLSGATITAAKLCLWGVEDNSDTDFTIRLQNWTGTVPIGEPTFTQFDGVNYDNGGFSTASFITTGYNNITISDFNLINQGSNTTICVRSSRDISATPPAYNVFEFVEFYDYNSGNSAKYPLLEITYTVNSAPTIGSPSITWDDTDNCYAQKQNYAVQVVYTDVNGYADMSVCEMFLKTGANVTRAEFAYVVSTSTFSTVSGSTEWTMTGTNTSAGNTITITWNINAQWDATEESDLDLFFFANDTAATSVNSLSDQNFDVVTRLVTSGLASNDSRTDISGGVTITGIVYYANNPASNTASTSYPPDAEFTSVAVHDAAHAVQETDVTISNGAFSVAFAISNAVQSNTYHVYLNMADADYTDADALDGDTVAVIGDRIRIDSLASTDTRANVGDTVTIYATASLEYDGHPLGVGDALTLTGHVFTWDTVDGRFEHNETILVVGDHTINSFTSGSEAGFTITEGNINAQTETTIWDSLMIFNVQTVQYKGSGGFYYQAQIEWVWDSVLIDGAIGGVAYPNGTAIGSTTSNVTGWLVFVINQGNATNGDFIIYGIDDNLWDITVAGSNKTFTLWNWTLATEDIAGSALSNTNLAITHGATSVWTGTSCTLYVPADTFAISITWLQSLPVNTTAAVTVAGATSTDFNCTVYPLTGTIYHFATNTTISSNSYASEILSLSFSGATSTYTFVIDKPQAPTYIINATYNYATVYTPYTYLALPHYGNQSLQVSYEWGTDLYLQKTTHKFLTVTMVGQLMSITATGTSGDIATVEVYCGSRGNPVTVTGWIGTSYSSTLKVLTGTLTFASDQIVTMTWTSSGTGPGGTQPPVISPLIATVIVSFPLKNTQGTTINANVSITWTGVTVVTVQEIFIDSPEYATWQLLVPDGLPQQLTITGAMGQATIPITLQIPADAEPGSYVVPCIVSFGWESGAGTKTFRTVSNLDVIVPPPTVPDLMTYWWLIMFAGLAVGMLVLRGTRKH